MVPHSQHIDAILFLWLPFDSRLAQLATGKESPNLYFKPSWKSVPKVKTCATLKPSHTELNHNIKINVVMLLLCHRLVQTLLRWLHMSNLLSCRFISFCIILHIFSKLHWLYFVEIYQWPKHLCIHGGTNPRRSWSKDSWWWILERCQGALFQI